MKKIAIIILAIASISCAKQSKTAANLEQYLAVESVEKMTFTAVADITASDSIRLEHEFMEAVTNSESKRIERGQELLKEMKNFREIIPIQTGANPDKESYLNELKTRLEEKLSSYDALISQAEEDGAKEVVEYFSRARAIDNKIANYLGWLIDARNSDTEALMVDSWYYCPACGDVYRSSDLFDKCDICGCEVSEIIKTAPQTL